MQSGGAISLISRSAIPSGNNRHVKHARIVGDGHAVGSGVANGDAMVGSNNVTSSQQADRCSSLNQGGPIHASRYRHTVGVFAITLR